MKKLKLFCNIPRSDSMRSAELGNHNSIQLQSSILIIYYLCDLLNQLINSYTRKLFDRYTFKVSTWVSTSTTNKSFHS